MTKKWQKNDRKMTEKWQVGFKNDKKMTRPNDRKMTEKWQKNDKLIISRILSLWLTKFILSLISHYESLWAMKNIFNDTNPLTKDVLPLHLNIWLAPSAFSAALAEAAASRDPLSSRRNWTSSRRMRGIGSHDGFPSLGWRDRTQPKLGVKFAVKFNACVLLWINE